MLRYPTHRSSAIDIVFDFLKNLKALLVYWSKQIGVKEPVFKKLDKGLISLINIELIALILSTLPRLPCNILSPIFTSLGLV